MRSGSRLQHPYVIAAQQQHRTNAAGFQAHPLDTTVCQAQERLGCVMVCLLAGNRSRRRSSRRPIRGRIRLLFPKERTQRSTWEAYEELSQYWLKGSLQLFLIHQHHIQCGIQHPRF